MSPMKIRQIASAGKITEGPYWQEDNKTLLYIDIPDGKIHRYFAESGRIQELQIEKGGPTGDTVTFVIPTAQDEEVLIFGHGRSVAGVKWGPNAPDKSSSTAKDFTQIDIGKETRFNDGKCDPRGRIWAGTMGFETLPGDLDKHQGTLYRFDEDLKATSVIDKITLSNGLAWSSDQKHFYYIDTMEHKVDVFDYNEITGDISNRRTVREYKSIGLTEDLPDGMTLDVNGNLWVANYFGRKIICLDPVTGKLIREVDTVIKCPTSVCWGGPDYSTLYFTSGRFGCAEDEIKANPSSGGVFEITGLGTKGYPSVPANISKAVLDQIKSAS